jgi:long-chain acyl-CoA synthetase
MRSKIVALPGDIGRPLCNFTDEMCAEIAAAGGIHVIINSAGLVSFTPSLESAIRINSLGAKNVLDLARKLGAKLVHVSTCYVAGRRDGDVWEDEPVLGYFPRSQAIQNDYRREEEELLDRDFDAQAEIADCLKAIDQARDRSNDRQHISQFREKAAEYLEGQRRDPDDDNDLKLAVARERKIWMNDVLTKVGMERAEHWGWTNTYTYTKSLGEQIILGDTSVTSTIVRPAIVESSVRYPFPGWNEGFNTTAPLMYLMLKGHRSVPVGTDTALDIISVDFIAAGMLLATAAILAGEHEPIYQLGSSDSNRISSRRLTQLTALAVRATHKAKEAAGEDKLKSRLKARLEPMAVTYEHFDRYSAPMIKRVADRLIEMIDTKLPSWGAPRVEAFAERARDELQKVSTFTGQVKELVELFKPFTTDHDIAFRCDNIRALWARVSPLDQDKLLWAPRDWSTGASTGSAPTSRASRSGCSTSSTRSSGPSRRPVYTYKSICSSCGESTVKLNRNRQAMRLLPQDDGRRASSRVYTFGRRRDGVAGRGRAAPAGVKADGSRDRDARTGPEWGLAYFATILTPARPRCRSTRS